MGKHSSMKIQISERRNKVKIENLDVSSQLSPGATVMCIEPGLLSLSFFVMLKNFAWQFPNVYTEFCSCPMFSPLPFPTWNLFPTKSLQFNIYFFDPLSLIMVALMSVLGTGTWAIRTEQGRKLRYTHTSVAKWAQHKAMLLPPASLTPWLAWWPEASAELQMLWSWMSPLSGSWQGACLWEGSQPCRYCKTPLSWRHGVSENLESILVTRGCSCFSVSSQDIIAPPLCYNVSLLLVFPVDCKLQSQKKHAVFNKTYRAVMCSPCHQAALHTASVAVSFSRHCLRRGWIRMLSAPAAAS